MQVYRMAERNIGVESLYDKVHRRCAPYAVEGTPDLIVRTTQADIDRERALELAAIWLGPLLEKADLSPAEQP